MTGYPRSRHRPAPAIRRKHGILRREAPGAQRKRSRAVWACAVVLAVLWLPATAAGESSVPSPEAATFKDCHDLAAGVRGVPIEQAQTYVPQDYTVKPDLADPTGTETPLLISELRCDKVTLGAEALQGPVSMAFAYFELTGAPARSDDDRDMGDVYLLFFSTDSRPLADWLRKGTHLKAYYVPDLVYDYSIRSPYGTPPTAADFSFRAPAPQNWAFTVSGRASVQHQAPVPLPAGLAWQDTKTHGKTWRVKIELSGRDDYIAPTAGITIRAAPGSVIEKIIGPDPRHDPIAGSVLIDEWSAKITREIIEP